MRKIKDLVSSDVHTKGEGGIEVEMEGDSLAHHNFGMWRAERDGSLKGRDTAEYVLRRPIPFKDAGRALQELTRELNGASLEPSMRAGVHVHINAQEMTLVQVANLTTLYLVLEDLLLEVCGEGRQSNLFCLKGCEAELLVNNAAKFFKSENLGYISNDDIRYSGINLSAIAKFGSVEFRAFRSPKDLMEILPWVETLKCLAMYAVERYDNPIQIIRAYSEFNPEMFVREMAPAYAEQLMLVPDWKARIQRGMRSAQDLAFSQTWEPKVEVDLSDEDEVLQRMAAAYPDIDRAALLAVYRQRMEIVHDNTPEGNAPF